VSIVPLVDDVRLAIDLWDLDAWLNAHTLNLPHDEPAFALSREVFLLFAELTSGHLTDDDMGACLQRVAMAHASGRRA